MFSVIIHLFIGIIQRFLFGIGGISRWFIFQIYNESFTKTHPKNLDYYIDNKNNKKDKNGFTIQQKNFFIGTIVLILLLVLLEKFENK